MQQTPPKLLLSKINPSLEKNGGFLNTLSKAGFVVFRNKQDTTQVLLIHRLKQDDWSFPKGHVEPGEGVLEGALREILEETGLEPFVLGKLESLRYLDSKQASVELDFFLGFSDSDDFSKKIEQGEEPAWVNIDEVEKTLSYDNLREYFRDYIYPLLSTTETKPAHLVYSKTENYQEGVFALSKTLEIAGLTNTAVELDSFVPTKQSLAYFVTNEIRSRTAAFWANEEGCNVINFPIMRTWLTKSISQQLLSNNQIPSSTKVEPSKTIGGFMKSEYHGLTNKTPIQKQNPWETYQEGMVDLNEYSETKITYVAGKTHSSSQVQISPGLKKVLHRIFDLFGLEVFSCDIATHNTNAEDYIILDLNPAPAMLHNEQARKQFGEFIKILASLRR